MMSGLWRGDSPLERGLRGVLWRDEQLGLKSFAAIFLKWSLSAFRWLLLISEAVYWRHMLFAPLQDRGGSYIVFW